MMHKTYFGHVETPLGQLLLTSCEDKLTGLYFAQQPHAPRLNDWVEQNNAAIFAEARTQIAEYVAGKRRQFDLPLAPVGTSFQQLVWNEIAGIPFGQTVTYGELARRIGRSYRDARAVGTATRQNPVCWIVPCHRVVGRHGALTGYAGGLARKAALLDFEAGQAEGRDAKLELGDAEGMLVAA